MKKVLLVGILGFLLASCCVVEKQFSNVVFAKTQAHSIVTKYKNYLSTLPKAKTESIIKAKDYYFKTISVKESQKLKDDAFECFYEFYINVINEANGTGYGINVFEGSEGKPYEESLKIKKAFYQTNGIVLIPNEGEWYPSEDTDFLLNTFGHYISPKRKDYFLISKSTQGIFYDAWLNISWEKFRNIIIQIEDYINKYPDFKETNYLKRKLHFYISVYTTGFENTMITKSGINPQRYPRHKSALKNELKNSYETFLKENKNSKYYPLILKSYDLLKAQNFIVDKSYMDKTEKELKKHEN